MKKNVMISFGCETVYTYIKLVYKYHIRKYFELVFRINRNKNAVFINIINFVLTSVVMGKKRLFLPTMVLRKNYLRRKRSLQQFYHTYSQPASW